VFDVIAGGENILDLARDFSCVEKLVLGENDIPRDLELLCPWMIDAINLSRLISDEKPHHQLLVELIVTRLLVDMAVHLAPPFSKVLDGGFLAIPCFVGSFPIESLRWKAVADVCGSENSFSP